MTKSRGKGRSWFGWALGVLAALTLVAATPQHLLDFDEAAGPIAELATHGHGRTLMLLAEREGVARGTARLGLNVFAADTVRANALYDSLGYTTFMHVLHKQI